MDNKISKREQNRIEKRNKIVESAEKIFASKGYDNASMDEISKEAGFTKRTVYQYFNSKGDLFFAIALKGFQLLAQSCGKFMDQYDTGYEKIRASFMGNYEFYKQYSDLFKLIVQVGRIRKEVKDSPYLEEWLTFDDTIFNSLKEIIRMGKEDGTIRRDFDESGAFPLAFLNTGFFQLLVGQGEGFIDHFSLDREKFINDTMDIIYSSLKA